MFYDESLNQKFTKNTIIPNYPYLKDDQGMETVLYNISLVHSGLLYNYNYSFLEAIMGSYDRGVGRRTFSFAQAATNETQANGLATKYVIRFNSIASIVMGNLVDFAGEELQTSDFEFTIDGILQSNIRKSGLETFIANQFSSIASGESAIYNEIFSTSNFTTNFWTGLLKIRDDGAVEQLLAEAKDASADLTIEKAKLESRDSATLVLADILSYIEHNMASKTVDGKSIGDRDMSEYKIIMNAAVVRKLKALSFIFPNETVQEVFQSKMGNVKSMANQLYMKFQDVDIIGTPMVPEDKIILFTPAFTVAPVVPVRMAGDNLNKSGNQTFGISAAIPRAKASSGKVTYKSSITSTGTLEMDKVGVTKPLVSLWNTNDKDLPVNSSWEDVRDLALQVLKIT